MSISRKDKLLWGFWRVEYCILCLNMFSNCANISVHKRFNMQSHTTFMMSYHSPRRLTKLERSTDYIIQKRATLLRTSSSTPTMTKPNSFKIPTTLRALLNEIILIPNIPQPVVCNEQLIIQQLEFIQNRIGVLAATIEANHNAMETHYAALAATAEQSSQILLRFSN